MAKKDMKICLIPLTITEMQNKTTRYHFPEGEWPSLKCVYAINVEEGTEKEFSYTVGGNVTR